MKIALITGSAGLVGSEAVEFCAQHFDWVIGIDNNSRKYYFGPEASTDSTRAFLERTIPNYRHVVADIRDRDTLQSLFSEYGKDIHFIIHAAAQPSHDWAAQEPHTDFGVNAMGTMNLLDGCRQHCPKAVFILVSTNKVYGDTPNHLPLEETQTRWELPKDHLYFSKGIDESMSVDQSKHSLFGASKLSADILTQEYGRYFGMATGIFRCGCITGPRHAGARLHGFLSYLVRCAIEEEPYTIFGYKGKQVRDNIHSADLIQMFWQFYQAPHPGEVFNAGGGRFSNCSVLEAIQHCQRLTGRPMKTIYSEVPRAGDHLWWISDTSKFKRLFPAWGERFGLEDILTQIHDGAGKRA